MKTTTAARLNVGTFRRFDVPTLVWLVPWLVALVSYFAPWIARRPLSAALAWNAYDLFDLLRLLPEIESGALTVNLQALHLPLVGLAVVLPVLLAERARSVRIAGALVGCALAALTLPPYPQIVTAWRTPGWRVPFWWAIGAGAFALLSVWFAPRAGRYRRWLILAIIEVATVPAVVTLTRLLPALSSLHAAPVRPGWGFWGCTGGLTAIGLAAWLPALASKGGPMARTEPAQPDSDLARIREIKVKYETELLEKANVVAVGIGVPIRDGQPLGKPGIIVSVTHKVAATELSAHDLVPNELEDVRVWVEGVGQPHAEDPTEPNGSAPGTSG